MSNTFADAYAAVASHLQSQLGDNLAVQAGPPTSIPVAPASDRQKAEAWNTPHPAATDQAMWQLAQQKYAEHRQAGLPEEQAIAATSEDLTHFRYRARQPLYTLGTTSWDEQVAEARRLSKLAAKQEPLPSGLPALPTGPPTATPEPTPGALPTPGESLPTTPGAAPPADSLHPTPDSLHPTPGGLTSGY